MACPPYRVVMLPRMRWLAVVLVVVLVPIAIARATPPIGDELTLNNPGAGNSAIDPDLAYDSKRDRFMVVFGSTTGKTTNHVRGQLVAANGTLVGADFPISTAGGPAETEPAVAYDPDRDGYVVAWEQAGGGANTPTIVAEPLDADGKRVDTEDTTISEMGGNPIVPTVAHDPDVAYSP